MEANKSLFNGAVVVLIMRWSDRLIGLISTLILARLLLPSDFGVIAMASIAVTFVDVLLDLGTNVALIQKKDPPASYYSSAWTLRIVQSAVVALLIVALSPLASYYYQDERVTPVMWSMALGLMISASENIWIVSFQKLQNFAADFKFNFSKRIVGFLVTVLLTSILQTYWGMIIGMLTGKAFGVILSYIVVPKRPTLTLEHFKNIFLISQWVLVKNVSQFFNGNLHIFVVGGFANTGQTGGYTLANEISNLPGTELLAPINRVLFPAFVKVKDNPPEIVKMLLLAQGLQILITAPACVGLIMTSNQIVPIVLGEKWLFVIPLIQILAFTNIVQAVGSSGNYVLITLGKIKLVAILDWVQVAFFLLGLVIFYGSLNMQSTATLRLVAIVLTIAFTCWTLVSHIHGLRFTALVGTTVRPLLACLVMAGVLNSLEIMMALSSLSMLIFKIILGVLCYVSTILMLWMLVGKPESPEKYVINKVKSFLHIIGKRAIRSL